MTEESMRAYLATALTGLSDEERAEVFRYSEEIARICKRHDVLLYQPRQHTDPVIHAERPASDVYLTDRERVATSDLVIALCTQPSYGVGAENEIAAAAGVPVFYLTKMGFELSKMLSGSLGENRTIEYSDLRDLEQQLSTALLDIHPRLLRKRKGFIGADGKALPARLKDLREPEGLTLEQLATKAGITVGQVKMLENKEEQVSTPTVDQIRKLAGALAVPPSYLLGESPLPRDPVALKSLEALRSLARERSLRYPVYEQLRNEYLQSRVEIGFVAKTRDRAVLTEEDWAKRHERLLQRGNDSNLTLWE